MLKKKVLILILLLNSIEGIGAEIDIINGVNNTKKIIENNIAKNGFNEVYENKWISVNKDGGGRRISLTIDKNKTTQGAYEWTWTGPELLKIVNNGTIQAATNTLQIRGVKDLMILNSGNILSTANGGMGNQEAMKIWGQNIYIKNTGVINNNDSGSIDRTADIGGKNLAIDNYGTISNFIKSALSTEGNLNLINRKGATINTKSTKDYHSALSLPYVSGNILNDGVIKGPIAIQKYGSYDETKKLNIINNNLIEGKVKLDSFTNLKNNKDIIGDVSLKNNNTINTENGKIDGDIKISGKDNLLVVNDKTKITGKISSDYGNNNKLIINDSNGANKFFQNYIGFDVVDVKNSIVNVEGNFLEYQSNVNLDKNSKLNFNSGELKSELLLNKGIIFIKDNFKLEGSLKNNNSIVYEDTGKPKTLSITENYSGKGKILLNVADKWNDKLFVGGKASGKTEVYLNNTVTERFKKNKNGDRAILLIETKETEPGTFILMDKKHGIFRYELSNLGTEKNKDHFLVQDDIPKPEPKPKPKPKPKPEPKPKPKPEIDIDLHQLVSERIGLYIDGISTAKNIFNFRLYDRESIKANKIEDYWVNYYNYRERNKISQDSLLTSEKRNTVRIGKDLLNIKLDKGFTDITRGNFKFGIMGAYGESRGKSIQNPINLKKLKNVDKTATSKLKAYSLGIYSTFYNENKNFYVDTWALYGRAKNTINLDGDEFKSRASGYEVSLESGYKYLVTESKNTKFYVQPIGEVTYQGINTKNIKEENGTVIEVEGNNNRQLKYGVKVSLENEKFNPFIEYNRIHNTKINGVKIKDDEYHILGDRSVNEIKIGIDNMKLKENLFLWGNYMKIIGKNEYREHKVSLGIKYIY